MADSIEQASKQYLKILVVDDDDLNRRMMRILLIRDGHDVQLVANGVEALEAVEEQRFDVIFMDLQMPIMDGFEASRRIREWESGRIRTYIVALTASYLPEQGGRLFAAGIDNYISKPFELEHIKKLLNVIARSDHYIPPREKLAVEVATTAIGYYNELLKLTHDKDIITHNMVLTILEQVVEHEEDLQSLLEDLEMMVTRT